MCGIRVVAHGGPDPVHLVPRHARSDTRPADQDPPIRGAPLDRLPEAMGEVRVVVLGVRTVAAKVDVLVARLRLAQSVDEGVLHRRSGMVGREGDAHRRRIVAGTPARRNGAWSRGAGWLR